MPDMVCVKCKVMYRVKSNDPVAIEMAYDPPQPYRIRNCDLWECPSCGHEVLAGFAQVGIFCHEQGFDQLLARLQKSKINEEGLLIQVFERPRKAV